MLTCRRRADIPQKRRVAVLSGRKLSPWGNLWVGGRGRDCDDTADGDDELHPGRVLL
jgi:hypothetical protein